MTTPSTCQPGCRRPACRGWLAWTILAVLCSLPFASEVRGAVAVPEGIPEEAVVAVTWTGGGTGGGTGIREEAEFVANDSWVDFAFSTIDEIMVPVESSWRSACEVVDQLVPERGFRMHATGPGGRHWIQVTRWQDPIAVEQGLRRLGTRAMGGGRFRLPVAGLQVVVRKGWIVLAPHDSPWIERMIRDLEAGASGFPDLGDEDDSTFEVMFRHPAPVSGISRLVVHPQSGWDARIELLGDYSASPWPIRPASSLPRRDVERLRGRFALLVQESGIGLLDPMIIEYASAFPEIVPPAELRRRFAANRIIVLDGAPADVPGVGLVDIPVIGVVIPVRDEIDAEGLSSVEVMIDEWVSSGGRAVRAGLDPSCVEGVSITRNGGIRYLPLGSGFLAAANRHPMALASELGWTVCVDEASRRGWLVVGSSVRHVRSISDRLVGKTAPLEGLEAQPRERCMQLVMEPDRLADRIHDLARIRLAGVDGDAEADSGVLDRFSALLSSFGHLEMVSHVQAEDQVRASIVVRRRSDPPSLGDVAATRTRSR
ncbi:MAG: hypothetical protein GY895_02190 [Phycisphaera sp.]|nr:hypothetical protein [Phycisphaera sp.]